MDRVKATNAAAAAATATEVQAAPLNLPSPDIVEQQQANDQTQDRVCSALCGKTGIGGLNVGLRIYEISGRSVDKTSYIV